MNKEDKRTLWYMSAARFARNFFLFWIMLALTGSLDRMVGLIALALMASFHFVMYAIDASVEKAHHAAAQDLIHSQTALIMEMMDFILSISIPACPNCRTKGEYDMGTPSKPSPVACGRCGCVFPPDSILNPKKEN